MLIKKIQVIQEKNSYNNNVRTTANTFTVYWVADTEVRLSGHFIIINYKHKI